MPEPSQLLTHLEALSSRAMTKLQTTACIPGREVAVYQVQDAW